MPRCSGITTPLHDFFLPTLETDLAYGRHLNHYDTGGHITYYDQKRVGMLRFICEGDFKERPYSRRDDSLRIRPF